MLRTLALLLTLALSLVACGGQEDSALEVTTDDAIDAVSEAADAVDSATGAEVAVEIPDAVVCEGLQAVLDGYDDFIQADPDSDQQREAVELIGQFGRNVADVIGVDSPEVEQAIDLLHENAATVVSEGQSVAEEAEVQAALQTVEDARADCA